MTKKLNVGLVLGLLFFPYFVVAAENLIDHKLPLDKGGVYRAQNAVPVVLGVMTVAGALSEGSDTRLGKTFWQSGEALVSSTVLTEGLKFATRRERPADSDSPNNWFNGSGKEGSFPSFHVAATTAMVTPFIMEYKDDYPWVMALITLPVYEMVARVKSQEHWQTDVLAGAAIGAGFGFYEHGRDKPFVVSLMPGGVFVGFRRKF